MLSINITISIVPLDEIKTGLVGFTKCIILSKASMFPTMVQFTKCKIPIPKHLVILVLQIFPPNCRKPQNWVLFLIRINYKEVPFHPDSDYDVGSPKTWVFLNQNQFKISSFPPWLTLWRGKLQNWVFAYQGQFKKKILLALTQIKMWEALKLSF